MASQTARAEFEPLVRAHHAAVFRSARRILATDEDALDVTQQVFLRVLEGKLRLAQADDPGRVLRWMAAKTALAHLRAAKNRRRKEASHAMRRETTQEGPVPEDTEAARALPAFLARLPEDLRHALVLRFQEGMSYAGIGAAVGCSEPSAHDRVQRGLARLRLDLAKGGFAGAVAVGSRDLTLELARQESLRVPAQLEAQLLALSAVKGGALGAVSAAHVGLASALLAVAALSTAPLWFSAGRGPLEPARAGTLDAAAAPLAGAAEVAGQAPGSARSARLPAARGSAPDPVASVASADEPRIAAEVTIEGIAVDDAGTPIAGALVRVFDHDPAQKGPREKREVQSDANGRFRVALPLEEGSAASLLVTAQHPDHELARAGPLRVEPRAAVPFQELTLARRVLDRPGAFVLALCVTDETGRPVRDAALALFRDVRHEDAWIEELETRAETDASGRAELAGRHLGRKVLRIDARAQGLRAFEEELSIESPGRAERSLELARGAAISGVVTAVEGGAVEGASVAVEGDGPWPAARVEAGADGRFELRGLGPGPVTLSVQSDRCSPALLAGVAPGSADVVVTLKRSDDPRDVGDHRAEIHGTVVDAQTGGPVPVDDAQVACVRVESESRAVLERELLPTLLFEAPRQRAAGSSPGRAQRGLPLPGPPERAADFHRVGLEPGSYVVVARVSGYAASFAGPFTLAEGRLLAGVELCLERGAALEGRVVDRRGRGVEGAAIVLGGSGEASTARLDRLDRAILESGGRDPLWDTGRTRTDARGRFRIEGLPPRLVTRVAALHPAYEPALSTPVEVARDGSTRVELRLERER